MPDGTELVGQQLMERRLSSRDKGLREALRPDQGQETADMATDLSQANILELVQEIENTRDPARRAILMQEFMRLRDAAANLMGPVQPPPEPPNMIPQPGVMPLPYNPATQKPDLEGGYQPAPRRYMDGIGPMQRPDTPMTVLGGRG